MTNAGTQLIEAILDAAKVVRRDGSRAAIVVMRAGGEEAPPMAASTVLNAIRASGATMYVVSPAAADRDLPRARAYGDSVTLVYTEALAMEMLPSGPKAKPTPKKD